jgi:hypothetical protein
MICSITPRTHGRERERPFIGSHGSSWAHVSMGPYSRFPSASLGLFRAFGDCRPYILTGFGSG